MSPHRACRTAARVILAAVAFTFRASAPAAQDAEKSLPDATVFLDGVRETLRSDRLLLADYTFTEKHSEMRLDSKGGVKKAKSEIYEVYPTSKPGKMYRRLIARDGRSLDQKELAAQDQQQEAKAERRRLELERETPVERERRLAKDQEELRQEKEVIDELFRMDEITVVGREAVDGRGAVLVTFRPRPGYRPRTEGGKVLQKLAGRAWIDEDERQLARIDAELLDGLPVGPGGIFRLQKGARAFFERRKVNEEIWLPADARFTGAAKFLFFVLGRFEARSEYSDYRKFTVSTSTSISTEKTSR
ncbi:MAG TPA: hypothetical protein VLO07_06890 [Thermoanaerobaculia bacterium]|nr:hypothetical protein [Thermoanaerobaculia bacterium]